MQKQSAISVKIGGEDLPQADDTLGKTNRSKFSQNNQSNNKATILADLPVDIFDKKKESENDFVSFLDRKSESMLKKEDQSNLDDGDSKNNGNISSMEELKIERSEHSLLLKMSSKE